METVRIYRLDHLPAHTAELITAGRREAARAWNLCRDLHLAARKQYTRWPDRHALHLAMKGRFALHSQTIQAIARAFVANVESTRENRKSNRKIRYPWRTKSWFPLLWPGQAVHVDRQRGLVVLPMGRGRSSLVLHLDLPEQAGACKLVWRDGFELHVCIEQTAATRAPGSVQACVDLGEIHQAAVVTNTGDALVVSGRGMRSLKRQRHQALGQIARKRARCAKGSRRCRKLQRARRKVSARAERRIRDLRHKGTRQVIDFCVRQQVGQVFIGDPNGVRRRKTGRHHQQRMSGWEYGQDKAYLTYKSNLASIMSFTGSERGTSSRCPCCGYRKKPRGRQWPCPRCRLTFHRDIVGATNMHELAFGRPIDVPVRITYRRPGPARVLHRYKEPEQVARAGTS
jgi:putative transposase